MAATDVGILDNYYGTGVPGSNGWLVPVGAAVATPPEPDIKEGTLTIITAGFLLDGADSATSVFGGIATEDVVAGAADGDVTTRTRRHGIFAFAMTGGSAEADLGKEVEIKTNAEVGLAADTTNHVKCGRIIGWDTVDGLFATGAKCLICINGY